MRTLDDDVAYDSHKEAFDAAVEKHLGGHAANSPVLTEEQHGTILSGLIAWKGACVLSDVDPILAADAKKDVLTTYGHGVYKWAQKYSVNEHGGVSHLVFKSEEGTPLDEVMQPSHTGRVFDDLLRAHATNGAHRKARGLQAAVKAAHGNSIPQWMCKAFTDSCPHCIKRT
jgi:hypothetical protein